VHKLTNLVLFPNRSLKFYANLYAGLLVHCLILWCILTCDHRSDIRGNHFAFQHSGLLWSRRCRNFPLHGLMPCSGRFKTTSFLSNFWSSFRVFGTFFIQTSLMLNLWPKFVLLFLYPYATPMLSLSCLTDVSPRINPPVLHIFSSFHCSLLKIFCIIQTCALGKAFFLTSHLANWRFWEQFCSISQEIWHLLVAEFFVKYICS